MLEIIIDTKKEGKSHLDIKGNTIDVMEELALGVYHTLSELKFPDDEGVLERLDLFHGALIAEVVKEKGLSCLLGD